MHPTKVDRAPQNQNPPPTGAHLFHGPLVDVLLGGGGVGGGMAPHRPLFRTQSSPAATSLSLADSPLPLATPEITTATGVKPRFTTGKH